MELILDQKVQPEKQLPEGTVELEAGRGPTQEAEQTAESFS